LVQQGPLAGHIDLLAACLAIRFSPPPDVAPDGPAQASLGHKEGVDPKVAADQRRHAIGVAIDTYTESDLESRREAVTKLKDALARRKPAKRTAAGEESSELGFRGKRGKTE
jgi:hypothetical protein